MGKPGPQGSPAAEYIGSEELTRRTETSQYPEEQKATAIPRVVASEMGAALQVLAVDLVERSGKGGRSG